MIGKKINQLATELAPATTDLTIIGNPVTGVSKKITLSQIANLFATSGTVTSVAVTETGNALTITGSPITTAGTINIGFAGAATQYVRGDGQLSDFPTSTGGGSSVSYYLNSSVSQGTLGGVAYRQFSKTPIAGAGTDISVSANGYIASYITDANDPGLLEVPAGNFNCELYFSVSSNNHNPYVYAEVYKYDGTTFTLLGSSQSVPEYLTSGTTLSPYYFAVPVTATVLTITDRIAIRIYANVDGRTVTLHTENSHLCQVVTTFSKGLTSLNNLTRQVQFLATGTSGTDFNIASSTATHTFNLPTASATNRGALSSADWTTFNNKQNALTNPITGTGASGQVAFFNGTTSVTGINNFFWDTANNRLGIGLTNPQRSIEIFNSTADNHLRLSGNAPSVSMGEAVTGSVYQAKFGLVTVNGQFASAGLAGDFVIISQTGATIFVTNSTEKMRVQASGNMCVGNTNDTFKIDVTGTGRFTGQLRLESTITDGTNTYTLPSATGTLALTSALSGYLPLTGGTLTGALGGTSASFSSTLGVTGLTTATGGIVTNSIKSANTAANLVIGTDSASGTSLVFTTDFSERMRINASGNVSINNTNDTYKLDVTGTGRFYRNDIGNISLTLTNAYINQGNLINFVHNSGGSTTNGYIGHGGDSTGNFVIINNSINALSLSRSTGAATFSSSVTANGGRVTIQGTNQNAVWFNQNAGGTSTGYLVGRSYTTTDSQDFFIYDVLNAAPRLFITSGGNLLVGGTSSTNSVATFQVFGSTTASTNNGQIRVNDSVTTSKTLSIGVDGANNLAFIQSFQDGVAYRSLILNGLGGNVGIGTTSPVALLNIYGDTNLIQLQNSTTGATSTDGTRINLSGNDLQIINRESANMIFYTADTERMRITSGGALLVNRSSITSDTTYKFAVRNTTNVNIAFGIQGGEASIESFNDAISAGTPLRIYGDNLQLYTAGSERMRITSGGNVGINNTGNASYRLAVTGNTYIIGATSTGADIALIVQNSSLTNLFYVINNGVVNINNLAGTGSRAVLADASGFLSAPVSDISVKQNIKPIKYGLNEILKMNPVWFDFIDSYKNYGEGRQNGNIAQEMKLIIPEAVFTTPSTNKMGINYDQLHAVYIKAIQELKQELDTLKNK